jgi:hypothetical protein
MRLWRRHVTQASEELPSLVPAVRSVDQFDGFGILVALGHDRSVEATVTLADKLHPDRFSAMSDKMAAIVSFVLGESWTEPEIASLSVTSDGFVLTDAEFFGEAADLDRNLLNLLVAAEVTSDERADFERLYRERVDDWRPVLSGPQLATDRLMRPDFGAPPVLA